MKKKQPCVANNHNSNQTDTHTHKQILTSKTSQTTISPRSFQLFRFFFSTFSRLVSQFVDCTGLVLRIKCLAVVVCMVSSTCRRLLTHVLELDVRNSGACTGVASNCSCQSGITHQSLDLWQFVSVHIGVSAIGFMVSIYMHG